MNFLWCLWMPFYVPCPFILLYDCLLCSCPTEPLQMFIVLCESNLQNRYRSCVWALQTSFRWGGPQALPLIVTYYGSLIRNFWDYVRVRDGVDSNAVLHLPMEPCHYKSFLCIPCLPFSFRPTSNFCQLNLYSFSLLNKNYARKEKNRWNCKLSCGPGSDIGFYRTI